MPEIIGQLCRGRSDGLSAGREDSPALSGGPPANGEPRHQLLLDRANKAALVSQLAEETDSKPVQCEFESHRGHQS